MTPLTVLTTYIRNSKRWRIASVCCTGLLVFVGIFGFADKSEAFLPWAIGSAIAALTGAFAVNAAKDEILKGVINVMNTIYGALGDLVLKVLYLIVDVSRYTQFIDSIPVTRGWEIVRDVCNMFFVLVLLAIAIGTILQHEKYTYSKTLPKLISAAILINFSKTIAGVAIDFSNIVMLTFVGAIEGTAAGNFVALLGMNDFLAFSQGVVEHPSLPQTLIGLTLAFIFMVIALVVVLVMLYIIIARVVALWFLVVLSPAAFFLSALPDDKGYGKKWWDQFVNYLIVGPAMMFFLWLSFVTVQMSSTTLDEPALGSVITSVSGEATKNFPTTGGTALGNPQKLLGTLLGIVMLLGTMVIAQQLGVEGGKMAGGVVEGTRAWAAGKKGPSPMRWVRERAGAFSKMREQAQGEKVKRDLAMIGKPFAIGAALGGAGKDYLSRQFLTKTKAGAWARDKWKQIYTEPKSKIGRWLDRAIGDTQEEKNLAGEKSQLAENSTQRAILLQTGIEDLKRDAHNLKAQAKLTRETVPPGETASDEVKRIKQAESMETKAKGIEQIIDEKLGGKELKLKMKPILDELNYLNLQRMLPGLTDDRKRETEKKMKELNEQLAPLQSRFFQLTAAGRRAKADNLEQRADGLAESAKGEDADVKHRTGKSKRELKVEEDSYREEAKREREYAQIFEDNIDDTGKAQALIIDRKVKNHRSDALKFENESDVHKLKAQELEAKTIGLRALSYVPDATLFGAKVIGGIMLNGIVPGFGLLAPFTGDVLDGLNGFGRRLMRELEEIQVSAIGEGAKHLSGLRDEVVKAIATGSMKGYSTTEQMAAQNEMIKRQLYTAEEVDVARRVFVERGARSAALEKFDGDVWNKYPTQAYGMTDERLVQLLEKNRVSLKDLARADAITPGLLKAFNELAHNVSLGYLLDMKKDGVVEATMRSTAAAELARMKENGEHMDEKGDPTHAFTHMRKVFTLTRGYGDDPEHLNIDRSGNFKGTPEEISFNKKFLDTVMRDDDIGPYVILTLRNEVLANPESELARFVMQYLDPENPLNKDMAMHVGAAFRRGVAHLADRGKGNLRNLTTANVANLETQYYTEVFIENPQIQEVLKKNNMFDADWLQPGKMLEKANWLNKKQVDQIMGKISSIDQNLANKIASEIRARLENNLLYAGDKWLKNRF